MQHINIDLIEWNSEYKQDPEQGYGIFGYPNDRDNIKWRDEIKKY